MPYPVWSAGLNDRSGTGYLILYYFFRSGTGYRITLNIYLYRIWYWVPDPVKYSYHLICCRYQILHFIFFIGSNIGYRALCQILHWVPDSMPGPVLVTGSCVFPISDPVQGTGTHSVFIYTGSDTWYQILLSIIFAGSFVGY